MADHARDLAAIPCPTCGGANGAVCPTCQGDGHWLRGVREKCGCECHSPTNTTFHPPEFCPKCGGPGSRVSQDVGKWLTELDKAGWEITVTNEERGDEGRWYATVWRETPFVRERVAFGNDPLAALMVALMEVRPK